MSTRYFFLLVLGLVSSANAQQLANNDFEDVTQVATSDVNYPTFDSLAPPWTSANAIWRDIPGVPPIFYQDTSYAYSGSHAAMMRTQMIGPAVATGNLAIGYYQFDPVNPFNSIVQGTDLPYMPASFNGYMDYLSMGGDSCRIEVTMSKWNGSSRDTLGHGLLLVDTTTGGYVPFSVPINYTMAGTPDTTHVIFLSSYSGMDYMGVDGSTLIVDSVYFSYPASIGENEFDEYVKLAQGQGYLELELIRSSESAQVILYDGSGRKLREATLQEGKLRIDSLSPGNHVLYVQQGIQRMVRKLQVF